MDRKKVVYNICNLIQLIATVGFFIIFLIIAKEELTLGTIIGMLIIQILLETVCLVLETVKIAILGVEIIQYCDSNCMLEHMELYGNNNI